MENIKIIIINKKQKGPLGSVSAGDRWVVHKLPWYMNWFPALSSPQSLPQPRFLGALKFMYQSASRETWGVHKLQVHKLWGPKINE